MSQKIKDQEEVVVAEAVSKTERFFEENGKKVIIALVAVLLIVAGGYAYKYFVVDKNEAKAAELIVEAQERFAGETPDYDLALNGDDAGAGFLTVADEYGSTSAGNLAKHYAGICYLHLGDLENAAKYLASYKAVKGLAADVKAAALFAKAVKASKNSFTAPLYLYKQGLALVAAGEAEKAKACFERISDEYPMSPEARDAEKMMGAN